MPIAAVQTEPEVTDYEIYASVAWVLKILNASLPLSDQKPAMKWGGEWHITIEVFRDLGLAFAVVLVLIYILMFGWFKSFLTPLIVMVVILLSPEAASQRW